MSNDLASAQLYTVRIFARDWPALTAFYRDTLGLTERYASDEIGWAEFDAGGPSLALERIAPDDEEGETYAGRFLGVSLSVADLDAVHAELVQRGVAFDSPPTRQPWGGVLAHLRDPEGNVLTLLER